MVGNTPARGAPPGSVVKHVNGGCWLAALAGWVIQESADNDDPVVRQVHLPGWTEKTHTSHCVSAMHPDINHTQKSLCECNADRQIELLFSEHPSCVANMPMCDVWLLAAASAYLPGA